MSRQPHSGFGQDEHDPVAIELALPLDIPLAQDASRVNRVYPVQQAVHAHMNKAQARLTFMSLVVVLAFMVIALRLGDATMLTDRRGVEQSVMAPRELQPGEEALPRADILDRRGTLLATSLPTQSLYADPKRVLDAEGAARALAKVLPAVTYEEALAKLKSQKRFVWIKRHLSPEEVHIVNAIGEPGLEFQKDYMRVYPAGAAAVSVVGFSDVDGRGLAGVERGLNDRLSREMSPLTLSVDLRLQHILKREMQVAIRDFTAIGGAGVVLDIKTGEVIAAVSLPDFDPLEAASASEDARFNRFALGTYELGSMFKILNTAAGFESGRVNMNSFFDATEPIRIGRFSINDFKPERRFLSTGEVFIYSSNIGSARIAETFGPAYQKEFLCKLGLCDVLRTELSENARPQVPTNWRDVNAMTISFGHGISVTPLHLMRAVASVLNGGQLMMPTFLKREGAGAPGPVVVSAKTAQMIRKLMRANAVLGSGKGADIPGFFVGGKTGTAEKNKGKGYSKNARLSSFMGAFPMDNPRYLILVMIDEPKPNAKSYGYATGGWVSAPVVKRVIAQMTNLYAIAPRPVDDEGAQRALSLEIPSRKEQLSAY